jgi:hypothetical protein
LNDPELKAIGAITNALAELSEEQRRNVLLYVNARYGKLASSMPGRTMSLPNADEAEIARKFATIGDLFDAANPQTETERALVVGYWTQEIQGELDFESYPLNKELKHLGHPVSNITRALDSLRQHAPRLILQTSKSGSARQARKRYKLTREGVRRVETMLAEVAERKDAEEARKK